MADGGGDLSLSDLTIEGAPSYGLLVDVPDDRTGVQRVDLDRVTVRNSRLHGVLINDQAFYLTDPDSTSDAGSTASLAVSVSGSLFEENGNGAVDYDGFRINEGGDGSIDATVKHTTSTGNGADGLELDERGAGDASFSLQHTSLVNNGFLSTEDPDDGIDVDEAGPGSIIARFNNVDVSNNSEQGVDLNENGEGDLRVTMSQVTGSGNGQEGIEFEEDDDVAGGGNLVADLKNVTTNGNGILLDGDAGLKLREKGAGDLIATVAQATALNNLIGGILIQESAAGTVTAGVQSAAANNNATYGLSILGTGTALVQQLTAVGNPDGALVSDAGVVVTVIPVGHSERQRGILHRVLRPGRSSQSTQAPAQDSSLTLGMTIDDETMRRCD